MDLGEQIASSASVLGDLPRGVGSGLRIAWMCRAESWQVDGRIAAMSSILCAIALRDLDAG
jgi:hypothetical protein